MQIGGAGGSAAIWLNSVGKTAASGASNIFPTDRAGQKEQAKAAAANTSFPTTPPVNLGAEALLALQQDAPSAGAASMPASEAPAEELGSSAADEFLDYMKKTPEERLRDKILKALGITAEELEAMPMEERLAVEEKIADIIKETLVPKEVTRGAGYKDAGTSFEDLLQTHIGA